MPKVSVILSSYNHAKFICESIENTLGQTCTDFELIIWDDGSSDNSWELIQRYNDPRIKAFRNEKNIGGVYGVNKAISEIATGEYIAIHHSDDVWELDKLQRQVHCLDVNPDVGAVFTNTKPIDERGQPLADQSHFYYSIFNQPNRSRQEWLHHFFFRGNALCHPSVLIRKQCYVDCGMYQDALAQLTDFDMWVRLCFKYEIRVLPDRLVSFRVRDEEMNASGSRPEVRIRDRSEFHYVLKHYSHIDTFDEMVSIFPEVEKYRRHDGCVPKFVFAMAALGDSSFPWARLQAIEILFDLLIDPETKEKIKNLYQFSYRDFTALTGKHDVFALETVANQGQEIARRDAIISMQAEQIERLTRAARSSGVAAGRSAIQPGIAEAGSPEDRSAYAQATQLIAEGKAGEGKVLLETLADKGSTCWEVYNDLAVQYFNEGDYVRAVPNFEKGMSLEGDAGTTARNCATMLLSAGEVDAALGVWGRILQEQPDDAGILDILRQVLSNINPITPEAWAQLVADLRAGGLPGEVLMSLGISGNRGALEETSRRKVGAPAREIKIFQIYYNEATRAQVDPAFIPLDNSDNSRPDWVEYWPIRKVLSSQTFDDDDYLGFFSPKFFGKTGMRGQQVVDFVRQCNDEVISFSPFFELGALHNSPFAQGEVFHPGLIEATRRVLVLLGIGLDRIDPATIVCDQTTTIFSNYFVARYSFWKKWLACVDKVIEVCEGPDCELKSILTRSTAYRVGSDYAMKVFVLERMVTVLLENLELRSRVGMDFRNAPTPIPGGGESLDALLVCDALKGQYRRTGWSVYLETMVKVRGS